MTSIIGVWHWQIEAKRSDRGAPFPIGCEHLKTVWETVFKGAGEQSEPAPKGATMRINMPKPLAARYVIYLPVGLIIPPPNKSCAKQANVNYAQDSLT
jgi:hypothetical protein